MLDEPRNPVGISRFSSQEFNRCLPLSLATFVATMVMVNHNQIEGFLGDWPFGALQGRSDACMDAFDKRRSVNNGIQFLKNHRLKRLKLILKETFGHIQPLLTLLLMGALWLGRRLVGEMLVVPRQHECIS